MWCPLFLNIILLTPMNACSRTNESRQFFEQSLHQIDGLVQKGAKCRFSHFWVIVKKQLFLTLFWLWQNFTAIQLIFFILSWNAERCQVHFLILFCAERSQVQWCLYRKEPSDTWPLSAQTLLRKFCAERCHVHYISQHVVHYNGDEHIVNTHW